MRDLLDRTGTIARIDPALMRVVPKYRTAPGASRLARSPAI